VRELSLHILDLLENAQRARASVIAVTVEIDEAADRLRVVIEDDGTGLKVSPEDATNPFYTTKAGKRTGLGLSLFRAAAEQTGGGLTIGKSGLGPVGVRVAVELGLSHVDRSPLGDLAGTLAGVVCTNPDIDYVITIRCGAREHRVRTSELGADAFRAAQAVQDVVGRALGAAAVPL